MKYEGLLLEGRWQFNSINPNSMCVFENIYNHSKVELSYHQVEQVIKNENTIGHIMSRRIKSTDNNIGAFKYGNDIQKNWGRIKYKNRKK